MSGKSSRGCLVGFLLKKLKSQVTEHYLVTAYKCKDVLKLQKVSLEK